ncbi:MAG: hypothetical protein LBB36_04040 [Fibromonadaceae bacterium]|jgi:hypothetical protein|nr:hypothetical protein [Fibromonadaceae bacterium]
MENKLLKALVVIATVTAFNACSPEPDEEIIVDPNTTQSSNGQVTQSSNDGKFDVSSSSLGTSSAYDVSSSSTPAVKKTRTARCIGSHYTVQTPPCSKADKTGCRELESGVKLYKITPGGLIAGAKDTAYFHLSNGENVQYLTIGHKKDELDQDWFESIKDYPVMGCGTGSGDIESKTYGMVNIVNTRYADDIEKCRQGCSDTIEIEDK